MQGGGETEYRKFRCLIVGLWISFFATRVPLRSCCSQRRVASPMLSSCPAQELLRAGGRADSQAGCESGVARILKMHYCAVRPHDLHIYRHALKSTNATANACTSSIESTRLTASLHGDTKNRSYEKAHREQQAQRKWKQE